MLHLQRASAGSGKTFTLAKKYLWYYITIRPEGESARRLRTAAELADSARHILAVTFTNKATGEMQMRIVDKLYALAYPPKEKKSDYIEEFARELGVSEAQVSDVCRLGLAVLLNNYSDFNISTIDSFFQTVLRTFAYETDISDAYQVELDSDYLSKLGIDATLEEIDTNDKDTDTPFWIRILMDRVENGKKWNMFQRPSSGTYGSADDNPYQGLIKAVSRLENEEYKMVRSDVERYMESGVDFVALYKSLRKRYEAPVRDAHRHLKEKVKEYSAWLPDELRGLSGHAAVFENAIGKVLGKKASIGDWNKQPAEGKEDSLIFSAHYLKSSGPQKLLREYPRLAQYVDEINALKDEWIESVRDPKFRIWNIYAENLPYFGLFRIANKKRREYLDENNAVELGETSMILSGVIGESDTPFIYERLGAYLNHFLIDEFQDTSRLQWKNMSPLLHESMARGHENLIIGDAKQSIYRFRNADPSLITTKVPSEFAGRVNLAGNSTADNTNWRSALHVVQFNNSIFEYIARELTAEFNDGRTEAGRMDFTALYENVVQNPHHRKDEGYVEARLLRGNAEEMNMITAYEVPRLIMRLHQRGYSWRDIAVLVDTNKNGSDVIEAISAYNATLEPDVEPIPFVSEQSLKVISSKAVRIITEVLESVARGEMPEMREGEERRRLGVGKWSNMKTNYKLFVMSSEAGGDSATRLDEFIATGGDTDRLQTMLSRMQSVAIPAMVEAVIAEFVPEPTRRREALYISAFQDLVLEYCESHPTDVASFLDWWKRRSEKAAISSPEDTDAVQVITVHKSKGLEYKCVICPNVAWDLGDKEPSSGKIEWRWVKPELQAGDDSSLPPYLPINVNAKLKGTPHEELLIQYFDLSKMDHLNSAYVAFTRAEKELYIFGRTAASELSARDYMLAKGICEDNPQEEMAKRKKSSGRGEDHLIGSYLWNWALQCESSEESGAERVASVDVRFDREEGLLCIGALSDPQASESTSDVVYIEDYESHPSPEYLKYRSEDLPDVIDAEEYDEDEDLDPRSEGNIKHAVLERVRVREDLPAAVRHFVMSGLIHPAQSSSLEASLLLSLHDERVDRWFDGAVKVISERSILRAGQAFRRPDRIVVFADGHAEVVDYKFGKVDKSGKYRRQVRGYVNSLWQTGKYKYVKGYLWYVNEGVIEAVNSK